VPARLLELRVTGRTRAAGAMVGGLVGAVTILPVALMGKAVGGLAGNGAADPAAPQVQPGRRRKARLAVRRALDSVPAGVLTATPIAFALLPRVTSRSVHMAHRVTLNGRLGWPSLLLSRPMAALGAAGAGATWRGRAGRWSGWAGA